LKTIVLQSIRLITLIILLCTGQSFEESYDEIVRLYVTKLVKEVIKIQSKSIPFLISTSYIPNSIASYST